jgi:hypothetical protein
VADRRALGDHARARGSDVAALRNLGLVVLADVARGIARARSIVGHVDRAISRAVGGRIARSIDVARLGGGGRIGCIGHVGSGSGVDQRRRAARTRVARVAAGDPAERTSRHAAVRQHGVGRLDDHGGIGRRAIRRDHAGAAGITGK